MKLRTQTNKIILHCADSPHARHDDISVIKKWHLERGFLDIGYHIYIKQNGDIQIGRDLMFQGAHVRRHNSDSIGVCLGGRDSFTNEQFKSLRIVIDSLEGVYGDLDLFCHNQFDAKKTCPNMKIEEVMNKISF